MNRNYLVNVIMKCINKELEGNDKVVYNPDVKLEDIGFNSLEYMESLIVIEKEFGLEFTDNEINYGSIKTLGEYVDTIIMYINNKEGYSRI